MEGEQTIEQYNAAVQRRLYIGLGISILALLLAYIAFYR